MAEIVERVIMSKDIYRFRWRIENFSKLKRSQHSKTFFAGRHEWRVTLRFPKGHSGKCVSVKLDSDASKTIPVAPPEVRLAFVDQLRETSTMLNFDDEPKLQDWCNDYAVLLVRIDNLPARGFLVNDTIIIEAEVSLGKTVSEAATGEENPIEIDQPREAILSSKTQDLLVSRLHNALRNLRTILVKEAGDGLGAGHIFLDSAMQRISKRIPRSKEELLEIEGITKAKVNKYGDRLLQTIEATVCDYYKTKQSGNSTGDSAKIKRNEGSRTKKIKPIQAINESLAEPLSTETQEPGISKGVDDPKVMHPGGEDHSKGNMGSTRLSKKVARTSNITSPCSSSVQLTSKNLLVQLSTVASNYNERARRKPFTETKATDILGFRSVED
ncbi:ATP-dependent DNA helicase Q-like 4A [Linum grandiflorum]